MKKAVRVEGLVPTGDGPSVSPQPVVSLLPAPCPAWCLGVVIVVRVRVAAWVRFAVVPASADDQLVAQDEAGGVAWSGVEVLDAAQQRLVVLQGGVP